MIKKIKKPNWAGMDTEHFNAEYEFGRWFDKNIQPINDALDNAKIGYSSNRDSGGNLICTSYTSYHWHKEPTDRIRALIIEEPIKQESCADVLRDLIKAYSDNCKFPSDSAIIKRAKAALEREDDN